MYMHVYLRTRALFTIPNTPLFEYLLLYDLVINPLYRLGIG